MNTSGYWQDLTTIDFDGLDPECTVALLPVAAVEQHGPHLPLATDAIINTGLIDGLLQKPPAAARVLILPAMTIGHSLEHRDFAGTLSLSAETLLASWVEVGASVARAGIRKLVLLNTHGGQTSIVQLAALRLRAEHRMLVARANYFALGSPPGLFTTDELKHGIHGGEMETSLLLHLRPDLVRREALADFSGLPQHLARHNEVFGAEKPVGFGWMSQDLHPAGVLGNAARADAVRGKKLLEYLVAKLERLIEEVAAMPMETLKD